LADALAARPGVALRSHDVPAGPDEQREQIGDGYRIRLLGIMSIVIVKRSASGYFETRKSLVHAIERRGLTVFARIDYAAAAREAGLALDDEEVVLFGSPRSGTPLMLSDRRVGIELPLRILVWRDGEDVLLGFSDPRELSGDYDLASHQSTLEQMATLLEELALEAAS
jgi:uncharacterized protein (DUF302 family)